MVLRAGVLPVYKCQHTTLGGPAAAIDQVLDVRHKPAPAAGSANAACIESGGDPAQLAHPGRTDGVYDGQRVCGELRGIPGLSPSSERGGVRGITSANAATGGMCFRAAKRDRFGMGRPSRKGATLARANHAVNRTATAAPQLLPVEIDRRQAGEVGEVHQRDLEIALAVTVDIAADDGRCAGQRHAELARNA